MNNLFQNYSSTQQFFFEQVVGSAEFAVIPDVAILTVVINNRKDTASDAKNSVQRRLEYVNQTLLNNGIKESEILIIKNLSRVQKCYLMEVQVDATFHNDIQKCLALHNQFTEKLDSSVLVLKPQFSHNKQRIEAVRKQTCLTAIANARQKAMEVCRLMGQNLGRPIKIVEDSCEETCGANSTVCPVDDDAQVNSVNDVLSHPIEIQQRLKAMTLNIRIKVTASFELRSKLEPKKKKC